MQLQLQEKSDTAKSSAADFCILHAQKELDVLLPLENLHCSYSNEMNAAVGCVSQVLQELADCSLWAEPMLQHARPEVVWDGHRLTSTLEGSIHVQIMAQSTGCRPGDPEPLCRLLSALRFPIFDTIVSAPKQHSPAGCQQRQHLSSSSHFTIFVEVPTNNTKSKCRHDIKALKRSTTPALWAHALPLCWVGGGGGGGRVDRGSTEGHLQRRLGAGAVLAHASRLVGALMKLAADRCGWEQSSPAGAPPGTT